MPNLDDLKSQRSTIAGRLGNVMEASARLREAEQAETRLLAEIGALGEAEVARMREWARGGAIGEAPKIDVAERTRLAGELAQRERGRRGREHAENYCLAEGR